MGFALVPGRVAKVSKGFGARSQNTSELGRVRVLCVERVEGQGVERWVCCPRKCSRMEASMILASEV